MSSLDAYSPLKVFHQRKSLDVLRAGEQPNPTHVQIILSDLCNQSCHFCAYRWEGYESNKNFAEIREDGSRNNNPNRMISKEKAFEILESCKILGVKAIQFTGGGEPTVHPHHLEIFNKALDMGFDVGLVTNGVIQRPGIIEAMLRMSWVRFSIDAGKKETYSFIRKSSPEIFTKVLSHIMELCDRKDADKKYNKLLVGVGFVVTHENWQEVAACCYKAKAAGADNFRISAVFQPDDAEYFKDFHAECAVQCKNVEREFNSHDFHVFNMFGDRVQDLKVSHPDYSFCGYQHFTTYIGGDLNVYRCCVTSYNDLGMLGSIKDQTFHEFWQSKTKKEKMEQFDAHGCPRCQFNGKNKTIGYALSSEPDHVNFV